MAMTVVMIKATMRIVPRSSVGLLEAFAMPFVFTLYEIIPHVWPYPQHSMDQATRAHKPNE